MKVILSSIFAGILLLMEGLNGQNIDLMLIPFEENGKWGYMNINDSIFVKPQYQEAYPTFYSRGRVKLRGKFGFVNEKGKIVIKPQFDHAEDFNNGIARVSKGGKSEIISTNGKTNKNSIALCGEIYRQCLSPGSLIGIDTFREDRQIKVRINRLEREDGTLSYFPDTLTTTLDAVESLARQYVVLTRDSKKALFFDQIGFQSADHIDTLLDFKYDDFKLFSCQGRESEYHEIFGFKIDDKWGYIELSYQPKEIIRPKYISINSMERGVALVEYEKGKYGYIDQKGKEYFKRNQHQ